MKVDTLHLLAEREADRLEASGDRHAASIMRELIERVRGPMFLKVPGPISVADADALAAARQSGQMRLEPGQADGPRMVPRHPGTMR